MPGRAHPSQHGYKPLLGCPRTEQEAAELRHNVALMGKYETMDLELRNGPLLQEVRSRQPKRGYVQELVGRWVIILVVGALIGVGTFFFNWAIRGLWLALYRSTDKVIREYGGFGPAYGVYIGFTLVFALLATIPVVIIGSDGLADGGGISELKAYFNGIYTYGLLDWWPTVAQVVSGIFVNAANIVGVGEAPLVHAAASLSGGMLRVLRSAGCGRLLGLLGLRRMTSLFDTEKDQREFVSLGASSGFSVAFITPIAGTLFPTEEGGLTFAPSRLFMAFISSCVALIFLMLAVMLHGAPGSFWEYRLFDAFQSANTNIVGGLFYLYVWELPIFVLFGVVGGVVGAAFVAINIRIRKLRKKIMPWGDRRKWLRSVEVVLIALVTGTSWFAFTYTSPCGPMPPQQFMPALQTSFIPNSMLQLFTRVTASYPQLWCPAGQYNERGTIFWQPLQSVLRIMIHVTEAEADQNPLPLNEPFPYLANKPLLAMMFIQFGLVTWTYGSAIAFGAFTPAMTIGAALGQLTGHLVRHIAADLNPAIKVALPTYAIVGAAAMLSGFVRYKVTATVLVAELSGAISLVPVIAVAAAIATFVGNLLTPGIYDAYLDDNHAPTLNDPAMDTKMAIVADRLTAEDVMARHVISLPPVITIGDMIRCLRETPHQSFPVSPDSKPGQAVDDVRMLGVISRKALLQLIVNRHLFRHDSHAMGKYSASPACEDFQESSMAGWSLEEKMELLQKARPFATAAYMQEDPIISSVSEEDQGQMLDLRPFMHQAPLVVTASASALQVHHVFRHLGCHEALLLVTTSTLALQVHHVFRRLGCDEVFVSPVPHHISGIISRKDITYEAGRVALWRKRQQQREAEDGDVERGDNHNSSPGGSRPAIELTDPMR